MVDSGADEDELPTASWTRGTVLQDRYTLAARIGSGGMASVYLGRQRGSAGFSRVVAIKRILRHLAHDRQFTAMFLDEAMMTSRVQHPNVVATLDVVSDQDELFMVLEYVRGPSLASLLTESVRRGERVPAPVALAILIGVLAGLHAAHEARDAKRRLLGIVHRDISPQNILVGADGVARIMDFGIAKARFRRVKTAEGEVKGKLGYLAPEQFWGGGAELDRGVDVFASGVVLWNLLAGRKLFTGDTILSAAEILQTFEVPPLAAERDDVTGALDGAIRKALAKERADRYATAADFADDLETAGIPIASPRAVGAWVVSLAGDELTERDRQVSALEDAPSGGGLDAEATEDEAKTVPLGKHVNQVRGKTATTKTPLRLVKTIPMPKFDKIGFEASATQADALPSPESSAPTRLVVRVAALPASPGSATRAGFVLVAIVSALLGGALALAAARSRKPAAAPPAPASASMTAHPP